MKATFASELDELKNWVDGVRQIPRFLRTSDARALFDALEAAGVTQANDLGAGAAVTPWAEKVGRTEAALLDAIRKCPFGLG